ETPPLPSLPTQATTRSWAAIARERPQPQPQTAASPRDRPPTQPQEKLQRPNHTNVSSKSAKAPPGLHAQSFEADDDEADYNELRRSIEALAWSSSGLQDGDEGLDTSEAWGSSFANPEFHSLAAYDRVPFHDPHAP